MIFGTYCMTDVCVEMLASDHSAGPCFVLHRWATILVSICFEYYFIEHPLLFFRTYQNVCQHCMLYAKSVT